MRTLIALALVALAASTGHAEVACALGPGRLVAMHIVDDRELWPSTWSPMRRGWAREGGMQLHRHMRKAEPADYLICVLYLPKEESVTVGAGVVTLTRPAAQSVAVYRPHEPEEWNFATAPFTVRGDDYRRTLSGGYMVVVAFPDGTLDGEEVDDLEGMAVVDCAPDTGSGGSE